MAQETYVKTVEAAEHTYTGDEARAHRAAWAAVKHTFEKTGDHWEPKEKPGPSDERAAAGGPHPTGSSYGGVDMKGKSKSELVAEARRLGARATMRMSKPQVAHEIQVANDAATRAARDGQKPAEKHRAESA